MILRGEDLLMEVLQRIGITYKTNLDLRTGIQVKSHPSSKNIVVIVCLTLNSRREKVQIHQLRSQLVESVARSTMVTAFIGCIIVFIVESARTRLDIALM